MASPYLGEIRMFAGNFAPQGWSFCNGQLLPINQFDALFSLIGTTYGGDGQSTFALPDLRGRIPAHQGASLTIGTPGGSETVTLGVAQLPTHSHVASGASGGNLGNPSGNFWAGTPTLQQYATGASANESMAATAIGASGGGQPHDNMMPFLCINFIVALVGIFPSQS